ncbi:MAG: UbiA family prenyltransferase [Euryarchaeota archaeon]
MILTLLKSTRLSWTAKNIHMYLLVVTYAYYSHLTTTQPFKILGGLILVTLLWGALYALNDLTDLKSDSKDKIKSKRPFIQNKIRPEIIVLFILLLIILVFTLALIRFPASFTVILLLMIINQIIYTLPPLRLKDTSLAPFSSTGTNNVLRMASCSVLLGNVFLVPFSVYLLMFLAGMGTYLMYKEKKKQMLGVSILCCILLAYILLVGDMNSIQFLIIILPPVIATIPLYLSNFLDKDKMISWADFLYHKVVLVFYLVALIAFLIAGY